MDHIEPRTRSTALRVPAWPIVRSPRHGQGRRRALRIGLGLLTVAAVLAASWLAPPVYADPVLAYDLQTSGSGVSWFDPLTWDGISTPNSTLNVGVFHTPVNIDTGNGAALGLGIESGGSVVIGATRTLTVGATGITGHAGSMLTFENNSTLVAPAGSLATATLAGGATMNVTSGTLSIGPVASSAPGTFTKTGAGIVEFLSNNTLDGPVTIYNGTLRLDVPAPAPPSSNMLLWLDGNSPSTMVVDGSNFVSQWNSVVGTHSFTGASGAQPVLATGLNGNNVVRFDGSNDMMTNTDILTAANFPTSQATMFVVYTVNGDNNYSVTKTSPWANTQWRWKKEVESEILISPVY